MQYTFSVFLYFRESLSAKYSNIRWWSVGKIDKFKGAFQDHAKIQTSPFIHLVLKMSLK